MERNEKKKPEISTNSCVVKKLKEIKKVHFIYIEFEYQNSRYSHDSMGQVHLLFINLFFLGFDWKNGEVRIL